MDGFTIFWKKYGGTIIGVIVGILLSIFIIFTNFYKALLALALIVVCAWLGNYIQRNKESVKDKTKRFIDKL